MEGIQHPQSATVKTIGVVIILVIVIALIVTFTGRRKEEPAAPAAETRTRQQQLSESLETITESAAEVNVPTANLLEKVLPQENPIEKTNPFNEAFTNPFE